MGFSDNRHHSLRACAIEIFFMICISRTKIDVMSVAEVALMCRGSPFFRELEMIDAKPRCSADFGASHKHNFFFSHHNTIKTA